MIREALIGDHYLSSTLVVEKVKKVCQLQENKAHFLPLMLTTTIQQIILILGITLPEAQV